MPSEGSDWEEVTTGESFQWGLIRGDECHPEVKKVAAGRDCDSASAFGRAGIGGLGGEWKLEAGKVALLGGRHLRSTS